VLKGVSIEVPQGGIVALLGQGAGKSTLKIHFGLLKHEDGEVTDGVLSTWPKDHHLPAEEVAKKGNLQIIEGRRVFENTSPWKKICASGPTSEEVVSATKREVGNGI